MGTRAGVLSGKLIPPWSTQVPPRSTIGPQGGLRISNPNDCPNKSYRAHLNAKWDVKLVKFVIIAS